MRRGRAQARPCGSRQPIRSASAKGSSTLGQTGTGAPSRPKRIVRSRYCRNARILGCTCLARPERDLGIGERRTEPDRPLDRVHREAPTDPAERHGARRRPSSSLESADRRDGSEQGFGSSTSSRRSGLCRKVTGPRRTSSSIEGAGGRPIGPGARFSDPGLGRKARRSWMGSGNREAKPDETSQRRRNLAEPARCRAREAGHSSAQQVAAGHGEQRSEHRERQKTYERHVLPFGRRTREDADAIGRAAASLPGKG